jgi:hypothetical protein
MKIGTQKQARVWKYVLYGVSALSSFKIQTTTTTTTTTTTLRFVDRIGNRSQAHH